MTGEEKLVQVYVGGGEHTGTVFEAALDLAVQRDNEAASEMKIQARELFGQNRLAWRWRLRKLMAKARFYIERTGILPASQLDLVY